MSGADDRPDDWYNRQKCREMLENGTDMREIANYIDMASIPINYGQREVIYRKRCRVMLETGRCLIEIADYINRKLNK